jgi:hypothetical protein
MKPHFLLSEILHGYTLLQNIYTFIQTAQNASYHELIRLLIYNALKWIFPNESFLEWAAAF